MTPKRRLMFLGYLAISAVLFSPALSLAASHQDCRKDEHCYLHATITTVSGHTVVLNDVTVYWHAEGTRYVESTGGEVTSIEFRARTQLGPDFKGIMHTISLYSGSTPISFTKISFSGDGNAQSIWFNNHKELSSKTAIIVSPNNEPNWTGNVWKLIGTTKPAQGSQEVTIRGSKVKEVVFQGAPPETKYDKLFR